MGSAERVQHLCGGAAGDGGDAVSESETAVPIRLEPGVIAVGSHSSTVSRKTANRQRMPKCPRLILKPLPPCGRIRGGILTGGTANPGEGT